VRGISLALVLLAFAAPGLPTAHAQPQQLSALPNPRLLIVTPPGGKIGSTVEVTFTGTDVENPERLLFSHPGLKAEPIAGPTTPPAPMPPNAPRPRRQGAAMGQPGVTRFKVVIAPDVLPGTYDVRLVNSWGVSNPRAFVVGDLNEVMEKEPNSDIDQAQRVELNSTINGAMANPTDVDYYVFGGKKGQRVVLSCLASSIDSRFHPGIELYDSKGRQLAANRNYHGNDALADCTLPEDGDYYVRLFEFTHTQGTAEHFYRLSISTAPWIDAVFPCVIEPGKATSVTVYGRNLPGGKLDPSAIFDERVLEKVDLSVTPPASPDAGTRLTFSGHVAPNASGLDGFEFRLRNAAGSSNPFLLTLARAPVVRDNGSNDTPETAQEVTLPCEIAGVVEKRHDRDWYSFAAKKGEVCNIEVLSDRLGAATYMYFLLRNAATKQEIVESVDNNDVLGRKLYARTEDPAIYRFVVPADGKYQLMVTSRLADALAGPRHFYRVRITPDQPDFRLVVLPADNHRPDACTVLQGGQQSFTVFAWRQDGFVGDIALTIEGLPPGVTCPPQTLGGNLKQTSLVVSAAPGTAAWTGPITIKGTATIKGQKVVREARSATIVWPIQPQQNIPPLCRIDRSVVLAVRGQAPYSATPSLDKASVVQGDKATLKVKVARLWPDFKNPLTVQAMINPQRQESDLPPTLRLNNNQPISIAANQAEGTLPITVGADVPPGTYNLVLRTQTQVPFNKDPAAKQKQPIPVALPSAPVALTVLPKQLANLSLPNPNATVKIGMQAEVVVRANRLFGYDGAFKVQVVLPPNVKGLQIDEVAIPAGQEEAKLVVKVAAGSPPGNYQNLVVRVTGMFNGTVATTQETKLNVNVVK
jgi:hypothetical protein